jgi:SAM-dependent methyltransferase
VCGAVLVAVAGAPPIALEWGAMTISCPLCSGTRGYTFCEAFDRVLKTPEVVWQVMLCPDCGYGWTEPPLAEEEIGNYYPASYLGDTRRMIAEYESGRLQRSRSWRKETEKAELVERFVRGGRILDVGCADARFLLSLDGSQWERWGVERSAPVVETVSGRFPELRMVTGDIHVRELPEGYFDVVSFWHVLEHLPAPAQVLARTRQLLKPGGTIVVSLPNLDSLQAHLFGRYWYGFDDVPRHLHHFTPPALARLFAGAGLAWVKGPLCFSPIVNHHCLKHSLLNWCEDRFSNRLVYYGLKPLVLSLPLVEKMMGQYGIVTVIGKKA